MHNPVQDEEILLLSLWNTFSSSHFGKAFTPLDALYQFYCEKGNNKLEEIKEQKKEEMVLFSIKILWKWILCLSFRVTDEEITLWTFSNRFTKCFFLSYRFCWVKEKGQKRNEKFHVFPLNRSAVVPFQFSFECNLYVHHCHLLVDTIICKFVKHFNE